MTRCKRIYIFILLFAVFVPSMKIQAAYRDSQGKVHLKPGLCQTVDKLEKSMDDMVKEFIEGPSDWVKSGYYSYEFLDSKKRYITIRKIDSGAVEGKKLVIPKEIDGHQVLGVGLWTDWMVSAYEDYYRVIDRKLDLAEFVLPEGLEFLGASSFKGCSGLKGISLPDSLVMIRKQALYDCNIGQMELPPGVYVEGGALSGSGIDVGEEEDNGGLPFQRCSLWNITMYSDSLVSFSNTWSADWGFAQLHIRYHEKDSYSLDLPGFIEKLYIDKKLSKFQLGVAYKYEQGQDDEWLDNVRQDYCVNKLIVNGKKTKLGLSKRESDEQPPDGIKGLYTIKGAAAIKGAKKYRIPYYWKKTGKAVTVKGKKKNGVYLANWKKIKTIVCKYFFSTGKGRWKTKKSPGKTIYNVYGKKKKSGTYKFVQTTKNKSIKSEYKYIKAVPLKEWD